MRVRVVALLPAAVSGAAVAVVVVVRAMVVAGALGRAAVAVAEAA
jgi:hypothetical protein